MTDKETKDTYEADDSLLNPSGEGEHTEVKVTEDDGTEHSQPEWQGRAYRSH